MSKIASPRLHHLPNENHCFRAARSIEFGFSGCASHRSHLAHPCTRVFDKCVFIPHVQNIMSNIVTICQTRTIASVEHLSGSLVSLECESHWSQLAHPYPCFFGRCMFTVHVQNQHYLPASNHPLRAALVSELTFLELGLHGSHRGFK